MSVAPPYQPPSPPPHPRPTRRRSPVVAASLIAAVVAVCLVVVGVWALVRNHGTASRSTSTSAPATTARTTALSVLDPCDERETGPNTGEASAGDPYLCWAGGSGYDALSYDVKASVEPSTAYISAHADVTVTITEAIEAVHLDLVLPASAVTVDGRPAQFVHDKMDLAVRTNATVGQTVTIGVDYAGIPSLESDMGNAVHHVGDELVLADQPAGAVTWVPLNGHPSDPAKFRAEVSAPHGVEAISVGRLVSQGQDPNDPNRDLWVWQPDEPVIGYTIMLAVGQYEIDGPRDVTVGGRTVQYLAAASQSHRDPQATLAWLANSVKAADELTKFVGDYPMSSLGGLVPPMATGWALETHGRPIYDPGFIGYQDSVLTHELAHFWFGDTITLARQRDIVINEGLASYCEYEADITGRSMLPGEYLDVVYDGYGIVWKQKLSDPGPGMDTFSTKVYDGGGAAVQALRNRMGDEAFYTFIKAWAAQKGPHSLDDFRAMAQQYSPVDLTGLLAAWYDGTERPAKTPENGLP